MKNARQACLEVLLKMEFNRAYSALALKDALKKEADADARELALCSVLVYGVCERRLTLDYNLSLYLEKPLKKLSPTVLSVLRMGAFQILFADKIPDSAAVNESIKLAKNNGSAFASGMINAVLRKVAQNGLCLPEDKDIEYRFSVAYSIDKSLVHLLLQDYGEEKTREILELSFGKQPLFVRVNSLKTTRQALTEELQNAGVRCFSTDLMNCIYLEETGDISSLPAFIQGKMHVQDYACQLSCSLLGAKPGDTVIDCCAAPGGKSFTVAQFMQNKGKLISCDIYPHKTELIDEGACRLGLSCIQTLCIDANKLAQSVQQADCVLCDVPCSGLGVIGRKPEIKYKKAEELIDLPDIQLTILENVSKTVKPGGVLLYSTCTLLKAENADVVEAFLAKHTDFAYAQDEEYIKHCQGKPYMQLMPCEKGNDGFFAAKLVRSKQ